MQSACDYSDAQRQMRLIHDARRTAVLGARYYAVKFDRWSRLSLTLNAAGALGGSTVLIQSLTQLAPTSVTYLALAAAIASSLLPQIGLNERTCRFQGLRDGWQRQAVALEGLITDITSAGCLTDSHRAAFKAHLGTQNSLEACDDASPSGRLVRNITKDIERQFPAGDLWMPAH